MERNSTNGDEPVTWTHPTTKERIRGRLTAMILSDIPGVRIGRTRELYSSIRGVMSDSRNFHAYFMNSVDGPIVGISEIPIAPDSDSDL